MAQRQLHLFPRLVTSLVDATREMGCVELVVSDWKSDDWPLNTWLPQQAHPIPTRIIPVHGPFCRGRGRNVAAQHAKGDILFFLDADCLVSQELFSSGIPHVLAGKSYFPVLFSFDSSEHRAGWWRHEGFGNCIVLRDVFRQVRGWPELPTWGREDDVFHSRVAERTEIVREEVPGFYHQWHPEEIAWKDRYVDDPVINRVRQALAALWEHIPSGATVILVDEGQFGGHEQGSDRNIIPFTEVDGVYWGPPSDDAHALNELARLRSLGADYIAFAWTSLWWLEYYVGLRRFLMTTHPHKVICDLFVLFDLRCYMESNIQWSE